MVMSTVEVVVPSDRLTVTWSTIPPWLVYANGASLVSEDTTGAKCARFDPGPNVARMAIDGRMRGKAGFLGLLAGLVGGHSHGGQCGRGLLPSDARER